MTAFPVASCIAAADVNGDGRVDLIVTGGNSVCIFTNTGGGIFASNATLHPGIAPDGVVAADIDNDGRLALALAVGGPPGAISIFTNNGQGVFGSNSTVSAFVPKSLVAADVNGDGKIDLITDNENEMVTIFTNSGRGTFVSNAEYHIGIAAQAADLNGDGSPDLAAIYEGGLSIWTNNGSGEFISNAALSAVADSFTIADLNGDGFPDLAAMSGSTPTIIWVWTNNGTGSFALSGTYTNDNQASGRCIAAADLNGDGYPELICADGITNIAILINDGTGKFNSSTNLVVGSSPSWILTADLTGDGKLDIATTPDGQLAVNLNTTIFPPAFSTPALSLVTQGGDVIISWPASPGWSLQQTSDLASGNWNPSGYDGDPIMESAGTMKLIEPPTAETRFFRLLHP